MVDIFRLRVVIDTNIVFEGLTKQGSASGLIIEAWSARLLNVYLSNSLAYEYESVLSSKYSPDRWQQTKPILRRLIDLARFVTIYYTWRPMSPDPGDEHVIDCALNANACIITSNVKDFRQAQREAGLPIFTPVEFINQISTTERGN